LRLVGLASAVQIKEDSLSELCGTLEYAAPEMLQGLRFDYISKKSVAGFDDGDKIDGSQIIWH